MTVIEVRGLAKRFGPATAVDGLTFSVGAGTVTGFLGPNGAGKTTTLRMLLGLVQPTGGQAVIWGKPYRELGGRRRKVGAVLEASGFHPGSTVADHLRVRCAAQGIGRSRVGAVLAETGMSELAGRRAGSLSLGERQRTCVVRSHCRTGPTRRKRRCWRCSAASGRYGTPMRCSGGSNG